MTERGLELVDALPLEGDETVLDAGCGTGQVTERLLGRCAHVVALDGSENMLEIARSRLGDERVTYVHADLGKPLPLDSQVDAIVSTSTFHWVDDHDALFANLAAVMRPGGALRAECGGEGNLDSINLALDHLGLPTKRWQFKGIAETEARLAAAGFGDIEVELVPRPAEVPAEDLREYLRTVILGAYDDHVADQVVERMDAPVIDYVRLVVSATRG